MNIDNIALGIDGSDSNDNYGIFMTKYKSLSKNFMKKQWYDTSKYEEDYDGLKKIVSNNIFYNAFSNINDNFNQISSNDTKKLTLIESLLIIMFEHINFANQFFLFVYSFHKYLHMDESNEVNVVPIHQIKKSHNKIDRLYDRFLDTYVEIAVNIFDTERDNFLNEKECYSDRKELYYLFFKLFFVEKYQFGRKIAQYISSYDIDELHILLALLYENNDENFKYYYERYISNIEDDIEEYLKNKK